MNVDKAEIVAVLRSRGLVERAEWVDRALPRIIDIAKHAALLRMLDIDTSAMTPADPAPPG